MRRFALLLGAGLIVSAALGVGPPPGPPAGARELIAQLADDDLAARRAAMAKLEAMGERVVPALRRVGRGHADVDVRLRAHAVAGAIEAKLYGELRRFTGHTDGVITLAVSPDGKTIASGAWLRFTENVIRIWDVKTGKNTRVLKGHTGGVGALAFLPGGKRLISGANDRTIRVWDVEAEKEVRRMNGHPGTLYALAVSGDGKTAVSCCGSSNSLYVWDLETGKLLRHLQGHTRVTRGLAFVPGEDKCLSACFDGTVRLWDVKAGKELASLPHGQAAHFVAARPGGKEAASVGQDGRLRFWDLEGHKLIRSVEAHPQPGSHGVAYSHDGKRVLTCGYISDTSVKLWDADTGRLLQVMEGHTDQALCVAFLPDGRRAISASYDRTLRLWGLKR